MSAAMWHGHLSRLDWAIEHFLLLVILACVAFLIADVVIAPSVKRAAQRRARSGRPVNLSRRAL